MPPKGPKPKLAKNLKKTSKKVGRAVKTVKSPPAPQKTSHSPTNLSPRPKDDEEDDDEYEYVLIEATSIEDGVEAEDDDTDAIYCLCEGESEGEMVKCDNDLCTKEWFHFKCVKVTQNPTGKWFCPECRDGTSDQVKDRKIITEQLAAYNAKQEKMT